MPISKFNQKLITPTKNIGTTARYQGNKLIQNNQTIYYCIIPINDIYPYCFVSRRNEDASLGFQRLLSFDRAKDIANYLDTGQGSIPTPIILSAQKNSKLSFNSKTGELSYSRQLSSFLVIDGQHRLYGYGMTKKPLEIAVAIYSNLQRSDEATLFIDINTNQRGVPAALLLDIKEVANKDTNKEILLRRIFNYLNTSSDSPLAGLLSPAENKKGKISRVAFNRAYEKLFDNSVMIKISEQKQLELMKNYYIALENNINLNHFITKSAYFEAFADIFFEVINLSYTKYKNYKLESMVEILSPLKSLDLNNINVGGKARLTKNLITPLIKAQITSSMIITDDLV